MTSLYTLLEFLTAGEAMQLTVTQPVIPPVRALS